MTEPRIGELYVRQGRVFEVSERCIKDGKPGVLSENLTSRDVATVPEHDFATLMTPFPHHENMVVADYRLLDFIRDLEFFSESSFSGAGTKIHSDRGDYHRAALEPSDAIHLCGDFALALRQQLGNMMIGWKGGEFPVDPYAVVCLSHEGETGGVISGIVYRSSGHLLPFVRTEDEW